MSLPDLRAAQDSIDALTEHGAVVDSLTQDLVRIAQNWSARVDSLDLALDTIPAAAAGRRPYWEAVGRFADRMDQRAAEDSAFITSLAVRATQPVDRGMLSAAQTLLHRERGYWRLIRTESRRRATVTLKEPELQGDSIMAVISNGRIAGQGFIFAIEQGSIAAHERRAVERRLLSRVQGRERKTTVQLWLAGIVLAGLLLALGRAIAFLMGSEANPPSAEGNKVA